LRVPALGDDQGDPPSRKATAGGRPALAKAVGPGRPAFARCSLRSRYGGIGGYGAQAKFKCRTMEQWRTGQ